MIVNSSLVTFYKDPDQDNQYCVDIRDLDNSGPKYYALKRFTYESDVEADEGSLVVQENAILIAPHNKMLNRLDGVWYLNDFVSTTPVVRSSVDLNLDNPPPFDKVNTGLIQGTKAKASITCTGGASSNGSVTFDIAGSQVTVYGISNGFTAAQVISVIWSTLQGSSLSATSGGDFFFSLVSGTSIEIRYTKSGDFTEPISVVANTTGATFTVSAFSGGNEPVYGGGESGTIVPTLEVLKEYAYKARYMYRDGHKTKTSFPVYIKTTTNRKFNAIEIDLELDIDGKYCDIEIFRKQDGEEFFLIDRIIGNTVDAINRITYIDDGKPELSVLDEKEYVWTGEHQTQAIARDRYVRANLTYPPRELNVTGLVDVKPASLSNEDNIVPANCRVDVFVRKRQEDGLLSFHKAIGGKTVQTGGDQSLFATQNQVIDAKEVALYAKYKSLGPTEFMSFNTPEIYNVNVPSIATNDEDAKDQPANPHILLGWRYITAVKSFIETFPNGPFNPPVLEYTTQYRIYEESWDTKPSQAIFNNFFIVGTTVTTGSNPPFPDTFTFNGLGIDTLYVKRFEDNGDRTAIYEMAMFEGLRQAVSLNKVKLKLTGYPTNKGTLSTDVKDTDILNVEFDVVGVVDKSGGVVRLVGSGINKSDPYSAPDSKVYLLLPSDSQVSKINNQSLIDYTRYRKDIQPFPGIDFPTDPASYFRLSLLGVQGELVVPNPVPSPASGTNYKTFENFYILSDLSGDVFSEGLIYLGKSTNTTLQQGPLRTGYKKVINSNFVTYELLPTNIYETLVTQEDVGPAQVEFPNQIIWSEPYVVGTDISGNRTFNFANFLTIQRDYGDIVRIEALGNRLVVFCERGVAVCLVGETLAQSPGGGTFVNATQFITNPTWVLKSIPNIQPKSIKQYEGMLFFCDGKDVWMFTDSLQNISQGAVTLTGNQVASIDPLNKEYRISGGGKTYAYSIETQQWFGPHTYEDQVSTVFADRLLSVAGGHVVEHNKTNLFGRDSFDTVVESVANELNEASVDKIYRKFYIEHDGGETFEYGKDYANMTEKDLADAATKQGLTHIGVNPSNATARQIFWRIKSAVKDFKLKMISFNWTPRTRR